MPAIDRPGVSSSDGVSAEPTGRTGARQAGSKRPATRRVGALCAIDAYLDGMVDAIRGVDAGQLATCLDALWNAWEEDRTVFIVGNGGSASTASHMANDLSKQTLIPGRKPLRAHALTDNVEALTAIANDTGYENVFAAQLRTHARAGDLLILISCSGNSPNLIQGIDIAKRLGVTTIAFGGFDGGRTRELCDHYVHVPSYDYGHVESAHLLIEHLLTKLLLNAGTAARKLSVLIDRDGVIVKNRDDYVKTRLEMEVLPGALEALGTLSKQGHRVFVVTNQSAIGRGLTTLVEVDSMHSRLANEARRFGAEIEAFLVCPHTPEDGCDCRKPAPGLLYQARDRYGVDLDSAVMIGDWETDVQAARAVGCTSILVMDGRTGDKGRNGADHTVKDLSEAVDLIVSRNGTPHVRS